MNNVKTMIMMFLAVMLAAQLAVAQMAPAGGDPNKQEIAAKIEQVSQALQLTPQQK